MLIEKGKYNSQKFIQEMKNFTFKVVNKIKSSEQKYKHDNLTTTECPTCGKFMIKVKTKMDRCLYVKIPNVKLRKIFNARLMHVALIVRKNDFIR